MKYIELKVHASKQGIEMITRILLQKGIDRMSISDPSDMEDILNKKHEYDWDYIDDGLKEAADREPTISAYFEDSEEGREQVQQLKLEIMKLKGEEQYGAYGDCVDFGRLYAEDIVVDDEDWKDKWKENFKPVKVTDRIVVKPTWEEYDKEDKELILEIDPGMAFGTGTHETTSLCMKLLEKYMKEAEGISILDVGCGSGILAISGALLGSRKILGIEIDEDVVKVARENVELNGVTDAVKICQGDLTKGINFKADIILANLMHNLVVKLAPDVREHLNKDGIFISSGIIIEKRESMSKTIENAGFDILEIPEYGEWCAIVARPYER